MSSVILATAIVGVAGLVIGLFLCFFSEKFKVAVDEREEAVRAELPDWLRRLRRAKQRFLHVR